MTSEISIIWFRKDLRISDNPALTEASKSSKILCVYINDEEYLEYKNGSASNLWLNLSLDQLNKSLKGNLNYYTGDARIIITELIRKYNVTSVHWNRCYEPDRIKIDTEVKSILKGLQINANSYNGSLLWEPWDVLKSDGSAYKVFTPYYKNGCLKVKAPRDLIPAPKIGKFIKDSIKDKFVPKNLWQEKMLKHWEVGQEAALEKLDNFINNGIKNYKEGRNFPSCDNISRLSPHIHFGEISPNQAWHYAKDCIDAPGYKNIDTENFLTELAWREFSYYLLYHFPELPYKNFQEKFDKFPWVNNNEHIDSWKNAMTGFPIIDAGIRELWETGYMHNRVRMIVGSFLVKNLLLDWRIGAEWFNDCLFDADLASNSASWQWIAGSGADAAPYFRIFNPVLQAQRFDPEGDYIRKFVPEIASLPTKYIFEPWNAPNNVLDYCKIRLGKTYPYPIVDLDKSRKAALEAYKVIKGSNENE